MYIESNLLEMLYIEYNIYPFHSWNISTGWCANKMHSLMLSFILQDWKTCVYSCCKYFIKNTAHLSSNFDTMLTITRDYGKIQKGKNDISLLFQLASNIILRFIGRSKKYVYSSYWPNFKIIMIKWLGQWGSIDFSKITIVT